MNDSRHSRGACVSSANIVRAFLRLDRAARLGPIYWCEDLVFGWLDFPLPEFGLRIKNPQNSDCCPDAR
jgi:hypothetical protein